MGIAVRVEGSDLLLEPGSRVPSDLILALWEKKQEIIDYLTYPPSPCSVLEKWRRESIPVWRTKLLQAIMNQDYEQEEYARWMLREILLDPTYQEQS